MVIIVNIYNKYLLSLNYIYDMNNLDYLSNKNLKKLLFFKNKTYYYNYKVINQKYLNYIYKNRNIGNRIKVQRALIINRCYGKYLPSNIILYNNKNDNYFDCNQALELNIGLPIHIIHKSKNKLWYFIKTYNYYCWVEKKNIVKVNNYIYNKYLNHNKYVVALDNTFINNIYVNMGTKFPINRIENNNIFINLPSKYNNKYKEVIYKINSNVFKTKYLEYNYKNFINQAKKYINIKYGWGGIENGIDCSGLICNILKTFNILIPRDTSKQQQIIGTKIYNVSNLNTKQLLKYIQNNKIILLYTKTHVMILYKIINEMVYILHASSIYKKVVISKLNDITTKNITSIHILEL